MPWQVMEDTMAARPEKMVARAIIEKKRKKKVFVLLVRKKSEPDTWELPGGQRKVREKWLSALARELYEELRLRDPLEGWGLWGSGKIRTTHDHTKQVNVRLYTLTYKGRLRAQNEILEYRWIPIAELSRTALERKTKIILWLYYRFGGGSR
jgi:8-oxo-dGTP pyrophosphatase MutT (NUDIX family)